MREGQVLHPAPSETVTCIRSGQAGGPFVFDLELGPGSKGPPTHTHDEGDEVVEVTEGELVFVVRGTRRLLKKGDVLTLTPADPHTFFNPSRSRPARARVTHGARFERLIEQPSLTAILMYIAYVDPGASRPTHPLVRALTPIVAFVGRVRGVELAGAGAEASVAES